MLYESNVTHGIRRRSRGSDGNLNSIAPAGPGAVAAENRGDARAPRAPEFGRPENCSWVLPESFCGIGVGDNLQRLPSGQDRQRLFAFHEGQYTAADGANRAADGGVAFRVEHAGLAKVQRAVPRDGFRDRSDVGRGRRQARRHVQRRSAGITDARADSRAASQRCHAGTAGRLRLSQGS